MLFISRHRSSANSSHHRGNLVSRSRFSVEESTNEHYERLKEKRESLVDIKRGCRYDVEEKELRIERNGSSGFFSSCLISFRCFLLGGWPIGSSSVEADTFLQDRERKDRWGKSFWSANFRWNLHFHRRLCAVDRDQVCVLFARDLFIKTRLAMIEKLKKKVFF